MLGSYKVNSAEGLKFPSAQQDARTRRRWHQLPRILLGAALAFVVIGGLVLGIALTVWTVLLFALPLMILFGLIASWMQSRTGWPSKRACRFF